MQANLVKGCPCSQIVLLAAKFAGVELKANECECSGACGAFKKPALVLEDGAEITVTYYALTRAEIEGEEAQECTEHCNIIMQEAVDQYKKDTGKTAKVDVVIYGHDEEKK